ncbi:ribosomal eL24 family protein, partial [Clostridium perfringens]|nr:ribosomal eL24 family protein [Clostridium perfringens]
PGHGKRVVRPDGKVQIFLSNKCVRATKLKRAPRDIRWTVLYRIKHKKGIHGQETVQKRKVKKTVQVATRAIAGMSLDSILAKRNQTSDFRRQQREQAAKLA